MLNTFYALIEKYASKKKLVDDVIFPKRILCIEAGALVSLSRCLYSRLPHSFTGWSVIEQRENEWVNLKSLRQPFTRRLSGLARGWVSIGRDLKCI